MNKHLSVFKLLARSTILKILAVLAIMVAAEVLLFTRQAEKLAGQAGGYYLENLFAESHLFLVFLAAYLAIAIILYRSGGRPGTSQYYTLQRLEIPGYAVLLWQSLWNLLCLLLLWTVQLWTVYLLLQHHLTKYPDAGFTQHHIFLAFWRHPVLHGILPLEDTLTWAKNFLLAAAFSMVAANAPYSKGSQVLYAVLLIQIANFFSTDTSSSTDRMYDFSMSVIAFLFMLAVMLYLIIKKYELQPPETEMEDEPCEES